MVVNQWSLSDGHSLWTFWGQTLRMFPSRAPKEEGQCPPHSLKVRAGEFLDQRPSEGSVATTLSGCPMVIVKERSDMGTGAGPQASLNVTKESPVLQIHSKYIPNCISKYRHQIYKPNGLRHQMASGQFRLPRTTRHGLSPLGWGDLRMLGEPDKASEQSCQAVEVTRLGARNGWMVAVGPQFL